MNNIKKFRTSANMTQSSLAEMVDTTQQTIARWEAGLAEPSIASLRDMAMIFGTSIDDLLGLEIARKKIVSSAFLVPSEDVDHYWGHIGLSLPGEEQARWYPISSGEVQTIYSNLDSDSGWIVVETLNHRVLLINLSNLRKLWMLPDAADPPDEFECEARDTRAVWTPEFYRGLYELYGLGTELESSEKERYSQKFICTIKSFVEDTQLSPEEICDWVYRSSIHLADGTRDRHRISGECLCDLISDLESLDPDELNLARIEVAESGFDCFYRWEQLAMIDGSGLTLEDGVKHINEDYK